MQSIKRSFKSVIQYITNTMSKRRNTIHYKSSVIQYNKLRMYYEYIVLHLIYKKGSPAGRKEENPAGDFALRLTPQSV